MKERIIQRGIPSAKIVVISNWADTSLLQPCGTMNGFRRQLAEERFLVMYSGNLGLSQNVEQLLEAASELRAEPISFVLIGEGAAKEALRASAARMGLTNVRFLPYQPKESLAESLSAADLHFIPLRRGLAGCIVPSKLYGILAVGAPYIAAVEQESDLARIAAATGSGLVIAPDSPTELIQSLRWCMQNRAQLVAMGKRGREAAEGHFSRTECVGKFDALLRSVAQQAGMASRLVAGKKTSPGLAWV